MRVVNILKDGTIVKDMSTVVVPKEIVESVHDISKRKNEEKIANENKHKTGTITEK